MWGDDYLELAAAQLAALNVSVLPAEQPVMLPEASAQRWNVTQEGPPDEQASQAVGWFLLRAVPACYDTHISRARLLKLLSHPSRLVFRPVSNFVQSPVQLHFYPRTAGLPAHAAKTSADMDLRLCFCTSADAGGSRCQFAFIHAAALTKPHVMGQPHSPDLPGRVDHTWQLQG